MRLDGKVAILTGATEGIGRATALLLAERGARLVLVARRQAPGDALVAELGAERAAFLAADVTDPSTPRRAVDLAVERFGAVDILVNNAAMDYAKPILDAPEEEWRQVFEVNTFSVLRMIQGVAPAMRERGGCIVNVTSRLASIGVPSLNVYGAAKGAVAQLTRGAAIELVEHGIRVNAVAPGLTETPLVRAWLDDQPDPKAFRDEVAATIPQRRFARPEEVAAAIAYLCSDDAGHVTGASIAVDGGYTAQ
jgi:NAD(P)-dependent dehydrogenase (short-subunit alcohol dehydrogenase family)